MHLRKIKRKDEKAYKQIETFKKHQGKYKINTQNTPKSTMRQQMDFELKNHTINKCLTRVPPQPVGMCKLELEQL